MKDEMVLDNINLIYVVLKKLNLYHRLDEFYDIAMIGLVKGVNYFDETKGYKLSTYLYRCIYNEILMSFRRLNSGREIPEYMAVPLETNVTDNLTLIDVLPDKFDMEEEMLKNERIERLHKEISKLSECEQLVINLSFGLNGYEKKGQKDICKLINTSQCNVSRIKVRALEKLKKAMSK